MDVTLRELSTVDAEAYYHLRLEALQKEPESFAESPGEFTSNSIETIRKQIDDWKQLGAFAIGAFYPGNELIGMVGVYRYPREKTKHRGKVWGVFITENYRGTGISKQIFKSVIQKAKKSKDFVQLELEVGVNNITALHLYKTLGFEICGRQLRALKVEHTYIDEYLMVMKIR